MKKVFLLLMLIMSSFGLLEEQANKKSYFINLEEVSLSLEEQFALYKNLALLSKK